MSHDIDPRALQPGAPSAERLAGADAGSLPSPLEIRPRRRWTRWLLVLLAAGGIAAAWSAYGRSSRQKAPRFETARVDRGSIVARVTATGTLSPLVTVQVGSQVSGRIQRLFVDFNSPVKKGQLIAKIDPQFYGAAVEQARANFVAAQGNLAKARAQAVDAERQYQRSQALASEKLVAAADRDSAQANADAARATVQAAEGAVAQARAGLHQAEINLDYTGIYSPIDGVVISRSVDVGQTVAASLQAPTLFTIAEDLTRMQVDTNVAESDVGKLKPGMNVSFTVDAYPGERFSGTVRQIRNAPQTVQNVVTYDAVIDVRNPELKLKPGMTANVTFVYAERDDVLRVPNAALRFRLPPELMPGRGEGRDKGPGGALAASPGDAPSGGPSARSGGGAPGGRRMNKEAGPSDRRTLWVLRGPESTPAAVHIRPGVTDGSYTEVLEGELREGDQVITDTQGIPGAPGGAGGRGPGGPGGPGGGQPFRMRGF